MSNNDFIQKSHDYHRSKGAKPTLEDVVEAHNDGTLKRVYVVAQTHAGELHEYSFGESLAALSDSVQ